MTTTVDHTKKIIEVVDVSFSYGNEDVLSGISLDVHQGDYLGLVGPNGAGKTTLLRAMLGEIPHKGSLQFQHSDGSSFGKPKIGYVPQNLDIDKSTPVSVTDLFTSVSSRFPVWLGNSVKTRQHTARMLELVGAANLVKMKIGELSGGQLQRVMLALALFPAPDLLLLDEPMSGMDKSGVEIFYRTVSQLRRDYHLSIFVVSHDMAEIANFADRMILLNHRILKEGKPAEIMDSDEFKKVFGIAVAAVEPKGKSDLKSILAPHNCPDCHVKGDELK